MKKISSISILTGTGECQANCKKCSGMQHRSCAPKQNDEINEDALRRVLTLGAERGCKKISITGSGEPMLSPKAISQTLSIIKEEYPGVFKDIVIYTNGIKLGNTINPWGDPPIGYWQEAGLTGVYISIRDIDIAKNAKGFGLDKYPSLIMIADNIKNRYGGLKLDMKFCVTLQRGYIDTLEKFIFAMGYLNGLRADGINVWPMKNIDDTVSDDAPPELQMDLMHEWVTRNPDYKIRFLDGDNVPQSDKILLYQDGEIGNMWHREKSTINLENINE